MLPGFMIYLEDMDAFFDVLTDAEIVAVLNAIREYIRTGEEPNNISTAALLYFRVMKAKVDRDISKYNTRVTNGSNGGRPSKSKTENNRTKPNKTEQNHTKPNKTERNRKPLNCNSNYNSNCNSNVNRNYNRNCNENSNSNVNTDNKNNEIDNVYEEIDNDDDNRVREEETPFGTVTIDPLIVKVQKELLGLTDTHYDLLGQYRADLGDELISFAIDQAVANGSRKWAYVEKILLHYEQDGIRTVEEAKASNDRHRAKGRDSPSGGKGKSPPVDIYADA